MANLAIRGHATRGNEVIEILEMLGGVNHYKISYTAPALFYIIKRHGNYIDCCHECTIKSSFISFTLEEFLEKFPYKIGDKVSSKYLKNYEVSKMEWQSVNNRVVYKLQGMGWYSANELQPYKAVFDANAQCCDIMNHLIKEETMDRKYNVEEYLKVWKETENGLEVVVNDRFELKEDNGKFYIIKKQPQYPKTYEECCEVLMGKTDFQDYTLLLTKLSITINEADSISPDPPHITLINNFYELLICRDAYWKVAGEQMGLGKPWEPDWDNLSTKHEFVKINKGCFTYSSRVLVFPTIEMRDAFYENFKDLIEQCKELL